MTRLLSGRLICVTGTYDSSVLAFSLVNVFLPCLTCLTCACNMLGRAADLQSISLTQSLPHYPDLTNAFIKGQFK